MIVLFSVVCDKIYMSLTANLRGAAIIISEDQVKKLLLYDGDIRLSQLGFSLTLTRARGRFTKDSSPAVLSACADELNTFIKKYESVMQRDLNCILSIVGDRGDVI